MSRTREILAMLYNANRGKGKSAKTGRELVPLTIDDDRLEIEPLTLEEHNEVVRVFSQFIKN